MTLAFRADFVSCTDGIGGEILQVSFDTKPHTDDGEERSTRYALLSRNFEFPGPPTIEWHDGVDYHGGTEILSLVLKREQVLMRLGPDLEIEVSFSMGDRRFAKLRSYLQRIVDGGALVAR